MKSNIIHSKGENKHCAGNGCKNNGTIALRIQYIRKTGYFCNTCAHDLLQSGLVEAGKKE
jgi:hypothetical protein